MPSKGDYVSDAPSEQAVPVGAVRVVTRYLGSSHLHEEQDVLEPSERSFDETVESWLHERIGSLQAAVNDSLPPGFIVQETRVGSTGSVEVFLIIAAVYRAIRDFNEVWETLITARDHVTGIVHRMIYAGTPFQSAEYYVSGRIEPYFMVPPALPTASGAPPNPQAVGALLAAAGADRANAALCFPTDAMDTRHLPLAIGRAAGHHQRGSSLWRSV